ncbi:hypothetical protein Y032_0207g2035 [Ancylostoma ceylanicum]|uniref:Uncharacterized protein n=1 Tax=Ancylostoma ceylanicum TaxID=53326 RepID=A0A016SLY3_9BILA|nr:hypothetical protein Y032_0207g2035 [Ancylostoma ceylanicum]
MTRWLTETTSVLPVPLRSICQLRLKTEQCGREVETRARPTAVLRNGSPIYPKEFLLARRTRGFLPGFTCNT